MRNLEHLNNLLAVAKVHLPATSDQRRFGSPTEPLLNGGAKPVAGFQHQSAPFLACSVRSATLC
jgi:hypothetical protein